MNSANWNLEAHSAEALKEFWALGSLAAIPAGQSVIDGDGKIPYKPEALAQREENRAGWPKSDPETSCYLPGIPRATYMPFPFQIVQGGGNILFVYTYASTNRLVNMGEPIVPPVDTWMGQSNGRWEGDTLVVETTGFNGMTHLDRAGNYHTNALKVTERFMPVERESPAVLGDDRGRERVLAAVDDQHAAVSAHRARARRSSSSSACRSSRSCFTRILELPQQRSNRLANHEDLPSRDCGRRGRPENEIN